MYVLFHAATTCYPCRFYFRAFGIVRLKGLTLDLEAATPLEFLESSWARAHLPAWWRFDEVWDFFVCRDSKAIPVLLFESDTKGAVLMVLH